MWLLIIFIFYLVLLAAIGVYCVRFNRTLADFVLNLLLAYLVSLATSRSQPSTKTGSLG